MLSDWWIKHTACLSQSNNLILRCYNTLSELKIHTACYLFNLFPCHEQKEDRVYEKAETEDIGQRVYSECQEDFISNQNSLSTVSKIPRANENWKKKKKKKKYYCRHFTTLNDKVQ